MKDVGLLPCAMDRDWSRHRIKGVLSLLVTAVLLLAACAKADPLDERVDARTMNKFVRWQEKHVVPLGEPIVSELGEAITIIARQTSGYKVPRTREDFNSPFNALCQRLDGWPLRSVVVEGYELTNASIRDRIHIDRLNVDTLRVRMNDESIDLHRAIERQEAMIQYWEDRARRNEARIRELRGPKP